MGSLFLWLVFIFCPAKDKTVSTKALQLFLRPWDFGVFFILFGRFKQVKTQLSSVAAYSCFFVILFRFLFYGLF